jgi:UDP-glucose 4-epimerase
MTGKQTIAVTGAAGFWGGRVAEKLLSAGGSHVIGLDTEAPQLELKGLDFIQADIRNPLMVDLLREEGVDTLCHLAFTESIKPSEADFDLNVMGTIKLLGACAEAGVKKVVLKSSTAVYGAHQNNSAFLREEQPLKGSLAYGYTRDMVEIEAFCNGFRRQVPQMTQTILRFSSIIGPSADTPLTRFFQEPFTPILLGFDPMMQVIHEEDVLDALVYAVLNDCPGVFNVAAEGVLPLSKLLGLVGKMAVPVFHLFLYWGSGLLGSAGAPVERYLPIELDYLRYPWVGDLRRMREELGFYPRYTAEEALREFASKLRLRRYLPDERALAYDEGVLRDAIERRRRARLREQEPAQGSSGEIESAAFLAEDDENE